MSRQRRWGKAAPVLASDCHGVDVQENACEAAFASEVVDVAPTADGQGNRSITSCKGKSLENTASRWRSLGTSSEANMESLLDDPVPLQNPTVASFIQDGFVVLHPTLRHGLNEQIVENADAAYAAEGHGIGKGAQSSSPIGNNILASVPLLQEVFDTPEVDGALRLILGDGYISHPHKRPHQNDPGSRNQTLHKDSHYGFEFHRSHVPWWVMAMYYPQDTTEDMAPTSVCPGTQYYAGEERFDARHMEDLSTLQKWQSKEVRTTCKAGTVVLLHNDIWHRGTANVSNRRRWMFCFMFLRAVPPRLVTPFNTAPSDLAIGTDTIRAPILSFIQSWMHAKVASWIEDDDVSTLCRAMETAEDDQQRLAVAYKLARVSDRSAATTALIDMLAKTESEPLRRAVKFAACAACYQQLCSAGDKPMPHALLGLLCHPPAVAACAARALAEHGAWSHCECREREYFATEIAKAIGTLDTSGRNIAKIEQKLDVHNHSVQSQHFGSTRGIVKTWFHDRGFGFITVAEQTNGKRKHAGDIFCSASSARGGELIPGAEVWFDIDADHRKLCAVRVGGAGVFAFGGRSVGVRNQKAHLLEALAAIPCDADESAAHVACTVLASSLRQAVRHGVQKIVGTPAMQGEGECLHFATLGLVRLISRVGHRSTASSGWWPELRNVLVALAREIAFCRPPSGARKAGAGGTPGADNGLRYVLFWILECLCRAGDHAALAEAIADLPNHAACDPTPRALLFRWCHLTNKDHTF